MNRVWLIITFTFFVLFSCGKSVNMQNFENRIIEEVIPIATESEIESEIESETEETSNVNEIQKIVLGNGIIEHYNQQLKINEGDYFGDDIDRCPILRVEVSEDEAKSRYLCLTFDSAYINNYTYQILDILDDYDVKATFFMTGEFMRSNIPQVREIINRGHDIGSHSFSHPNFKELSNERIIKQIEMTHKIVKDNFGIDMCLFRFPFGAYNKRSVAAVKELGYYPIQWTYDSVDWKNDGLQAILDRFDRGANLDPGNIILFHNGADFTPVALPTILEHIRRKGLKAVKISDMIYEKNFYIDSLGCQHKNIVN